MRIHHKTVALNPDSNLQKAATNHVNYVMQQGTLTHFQAGSRQLYDPFDRAVFYKAAFGTVGENIAFTYIGKLTKSNYGKPHTNFTYEEVADDLVKMWKHSAEHFKNLTEKEFTHSGIAIAFSYKEQALYAVQVYGGNKKK
ncbi:MAG: CAP domain-containing protein [Bacteroidetes bacterium]|nr:CAP domain-containing protein [Bacteroidota bacterium]